MIAIRRSGDSLGARKLHGFQSSGKHVFEIGFLVRGKPAKDVADHFARLAAADSEFQAGKFVISEMLEDGFDAVVATGGAFFAKVPSTMQMMSALLSTKVLMTAASSPL